MGTCLIIPALNPDRHLTELVAAVRQLHPQFHIIIVDDGSGPESHNIFKELKYNYECICCRHAENYGKGAALKTGIAYAMQHFPGNEGIITADADGQHQAAHILQIYQAMQRHPDQIILGTRDFPGGKVPLKSRWGNLITAGVFTVITGVSLSDTQTGLRGIPSRYSGLALEVEGSRYEYETHFLLRAASQQIPFWEVTIPAVYLNNNNGSHFRPVRDAVRIYGMILKYGVSSLFHPAGVRTDNKPACDVGEH